VAVGDFNGDGKPDLATPFREVADEQQSTGSRSTAESGRILLPPAQAVALRALLFERHCDLMIPFVRKFRFIL